MIKYADTSIASCTVMGSQGFVYFAKNTVTHINSNPSSLTHIWV